MKKIITMKSNMTSEMKRNVYTELKRRDEACTQRRRAQTRSETEAR